MKGIPSAEPSGDSLCERHVPVMQRILVEEAPAITYS
jgi:hypothetical protein